MSPQNRLLYRRLTASIIVSSSRIERWLTEGLGVPGERVHRLLVPIDVGRFAEAQPSAGLRDTLGVAGDSRLVVNVARIAPIKGQHVLVEAMSRVVARHSDAVLVLVGEAWSGEPQGVLALADRLGIRRSVVAAGRRDDVPELLAAASVCVSSSVGSEENSRAVSEYMAAGRPIVATKVGVVPELLNDHITGLLVEPGDPDELASSIIEFLESPERASRMAAAASSFARSELSRQAFARGIGDVLKHIGARR